MVALRCPPPRTEEGMTWDWSGQGPAVVMPFLPHVPPPAPCAEPDSDGAEAALASARLLAHFQKCIFF